VSSRTSRPFANALRALKKARGLTYRELSQNTRRVDGRGLTAEYINALATGRERPSLRGIELLARAFDVQPEYFAEYRKAAGRTRPSRRPDPIGSRSAKPLGRSTEPFGEALRAVKQARGLTYRELAENTRERDGTGLTDQYINLLAIGRRQPSRRAIELIAQACDVEPDHFAEYREPPTNHRPAHRDGPPIGSSSTKPFGEALREIKQARGLTYRELAETTQQLDGKGLTAPYINLLATGYKPPSRRAIELIAQACDVRPDYFSEYRQPPPQSPHEDQPRRQPPPIRPSTKPFADAVRALMDARGLTYRELARKTRPLDGKGITRAYIINIVNGREKPSMRAMELIARAGDAPPDYFAEYRLAVATRELDPSHVGLEQALETLEALDALRAAQATRHNRPRRTQPDATQ
jgi:transcriptional regulator with XRE-family HTH domain